MLKVLEQPIGITQGRNGARFLGKPDDTMLKRCLGRMVNWVIVAESTLRAEFPAFETIQAFQAFNVVRLDRDEAGSGAAASRERRAQLQKLVTAFRIAQPVDTLQKQLSGLVHIAERVASEEHISSRDAWRKTISIVQRARDRGQSTCDALLEVLVRLWASGASTSGVEQSFSAVARSAGAALNGLSPGHLDDRMDVLDLAQADEASVIKAAQKLWSAFYGEPRTSGEDNRDKRRDTGLPRQNSHQKVSERAFRAQRKGALDVAVAATAAQGCPIAARDMDVWADTQDKELDFTNRKRIIRLAEEIGIGQDASDLSCDDLRAVVEELERKDQRDNRYVAQAAKRRKIQEGPTRPSLSGSTIYFDREIVADQLPGYAMVCQRDNFNVTSDASSATVFVVVNIDRPKPVHRWNSALVGGVMCEWSALRHGEGPILQLHAALRTRRSLWMSNDFLTTNHRIATTIVDRMETFRFDGKRSPWRMMKSEAEFRARVAVKPSEGIALIGVGEAADWAGVKQAFNANVALEFSVAWTREHHSSWEDVAVECGQNEFKTLNTA